jgi:hypothetical protein
MPCCKRCRPGSSGALPSLTHEPRVESLLRAHGRILPARVIGVSKLIDLAVLKVEARGLPALPILKYTAESGLEFENRGARCHAGGKSGSVHLSVIRS